MSYTLTPSPNNPNAFFSLVVGKSLKMNSVEENWQEMFDKNNNISPHKHLLFQHKVSLLLVEKEGGRGLTRDG